MAVDRAERLKRARAALGRAETAVGVRQLRLVAGSGEPAGEIASDLPQRRQRDISAAIASGELLPVPESLTGILPGLAPGSVASIEGGTSLTIAIAAAAMESHRWCAVVQLPHLGWQAAHGMGLALDRTVAIPATGPGAASVLGAAVDGFDVIIMGQCPALNHRERHAITSRLRARGGLLLTTGPWEGAATRMLVRQRPWSGADRGAGHLMRQRFEVTVSGRGHLAAEPTCELELTSQGLRLVEPANSEAHRPADTGLAPVIPVRPHLAEAV